MRRGGGHRGPGPARADGEPAPAAPTTQRVLYAHPDRWTINAEFPPEERARMRAAMTGFAAEWLVWKGTARITWTGASVEENDEQRRALVAWRERVEEFGTRPRKLRLGRGRGLDARAVAEAAIDAVVTGTLWESPVFHCGESTLAFHRAWRVVVGLVDAADADALPALAARWHLLVRTK